MNPPKTINAPARVQVQAPSLRSVACASACAALTLASAVPAYGQSFPSRPVRMIVGFPPGGATDLVARILQPKLQESFGQQMVVDNRPGANGVISLEILSRSDADGHSVAFGHIGNLVISPTLQKVPYDPYKSFEPIGMMVTLQNIMIVHPSVQAKSLKDLIALAKAKPGTINYATSGIGSPGHLATVLFETMTGTVLNHIPYKGGGPALTDLIGGQVPMFTAVISTAVPQVQAGKARALAVTGARRSEALPDVPTVAEAGVPGYEATNWYGLIAPARTPKAAITRFHKDMVAALNSADVRQQLKDRGIDAAPGTPEEFTRFVRGEEKRWGPIIRKGKFE
ncbi:MAG: tripartite tricarboxylate transporter substrate binding protein [Rhodocyclaceae bacterium]|nr:tripartite tricarboxylate transporter substrate binding protein [Rhodocyclaceae bacterium]MCA3091295.1 tripartite tricarboxylate transporter substrate binding protein [Rhodocyclaceae bacterium]MCA3095432.1 tripartite tricarboxylate transporter substrate binding protein [Rhodocyclaceae bacterium]MCA3103206.1 tripartite tricarboxylate transporter substrate binding protein [Rhodocyclaceae bacterium]MCA3111067.1 tripartite tricarboxylate transporter substrate binding protein [Rhodocyclaceae bact